MNYILSFVVPLVSLVMLIFIRKMKRDSFGAHQYPPGMPAVPVVGNIMTIPKTGAWKFLLKLHRDCGRSGVPYAGDCVIALTFTT